MNKLRNHILNVTASHDRRKHRTNVSTKALLPEYRAIAGRSNVHNELTVVDKNGNTVYQKIDRGFKWTKVENAFELGKMVAKELQAKKINSCVFDRNGYRYIGRVKSMCDGLREGGIAI